MNTIIAVKPGELNSKDKEKLTKKGFTVIEVNDPDSIRIIESEAPIEVHDYYMAALYALKEGASSDCYRFVTKLYERLESKEKAAKTNEQ